MIFQGVIRRSLISEDPLWGNIRDPQSLNRFAYGRNNPYRFVDPTGKAAYDSSCDTNEISNDIDMSMGEGALDGDGTIDAANGMCLDVGPKQKEKNENEFEVSLYTPGSGGAGVTLEGGGIEVRDPDSGTCWAYEYHSIGFGLTTPSVASQYEKGTLVVDSPAPATPNDLEGTTYSVNVSITGPDLVGINGQYSWGGNTSMTTGGFNFGTPGWSGAAMVTETTYIGPCD